MGQGENTGGCELQKSKLKMRKEGDLKSEKKQVLLGRSSTTLGQRKIIVEGVFH